MRPMKLTMSAFGPYAGRQIIEFNELGSRGLYLVTGDTGAGKTTIFDGISYALFGEASGQNRAASMLRSQYASADTPTCIELEFEYRNQVYTVRRNPEYIRPSKHGSGLTKEKAGAEIKLPDGTVRASIKDVNSAVIDIIGVDKNQFSQIAMIAQGDFQKLLTASTEDRKRIFQKIFNTGLYEKIQKELADRTKKLFTKRADLNKGINQYASGVTCGEDSRFKADTRKAAEGEMLTDELMKLIEHLIAEDSREEAELSEEIGMLSVKAEELAKQIEAASILLDVSDNLAKNNEKLEKEEPRLAVLAEDRAAALSKEPQIEVLTGDIIKLDQELEYHNSIETLNEELDGLRESLRETEESVSEEERIQKSAEAKITEINELLNELSGIEVKLVEADSNGKSLARLQTNLSNLTKQIEDIEQKKRNVQKAQDEYREEVNKAKNLEDKFIALRNAFRNEQAGIMAETLEEGTACPVCGSTHHPAKAVKGEDAPTEDAVNSAEKKAKKAQNDASDKSLAAGEARASLEAAHESLLENAKVVFNCQPEDIASYVAKEASECKTSIEENKKLIKRLTGDANKKKRLENDVPKQSGIRDDAVKKQNEYRESMASIKAQISEKEGRVTAIRSKLTTQDKAEVVIARDEKSRLKSGIKTEIETVTAQHTACVQNIAALKATNETLKKQLAGKVIPDIELLDNEKKTLKEKIAIKTATKENVAGRIGGNGAALGGINAKADELLKVEKEYVMVKNLSDTAAGGLSGKDKIMLEAYVQAFYFDRIIRRANIRLLDMTGGQYELVRKENADNKRSQAGLDLDVLDHYNGTTRDVRTLSGGESFMASLSLALGLSDEVQQSVGGIKIDTLFVDEGFGSLDEETLNQAMDALISLTEGDRLVGIISHVSELKDRIDKQIVVRKTKSDGSVATIIDKN